MTDYQKYINALRKCAKEHANDTTYTGHIRVSDLCRDTANLLEELEQEPRKGHWIDTDEWRETVDGFEKWGYFRKCSKCGYVFKFLEIDNYCPNCGAKMESEDT